MSVPRRNLNLDAHSGAEAPHLILRRYVDAADGPPLIAVWGEGEEATGQAAHRLGNRETGWHTHQRGQVFCIESGLVHLRTRVGSWLLPPQRVGWIPPGVAHAAAMTKVLSGWNVVISPDASRQLPASPCVMVASGLLRALVRRAAEWTGQMRLDPSQRRICTVLLDELRQAPLESLHLPMPMDRRLLKITDVVLSAPDDTRTLEKLADWAGLSPRTLSRVFRTETHMSFARWRQQARLLHGLGRLASGEQVGEVAHALGYATSSNFIAMFRRSFGISPARYFGRRVDSE